jgi:plastocyanin
MRLLRRDGWLLLGAAVLASACGGGSSATQPPGPPSQLVINGGGGQSWYYNNPFPVSLSVKALDANNQPVPGAVVSWAVTSGSGGVSPVQDTTDATGVARVTDSIGPSTLQRVTATLAVTTMPTATFTEAATTPPTATAVDIKDNFFSPQAAVVQAGGTVTWTWRGANTHNLTFTGGPTPRPSNQPDQSTGTAARPITTLGTYTYVCTNHTGMSGTVTVVH